MISSSPGSSSALRGGGEQLRGAVADGDALGLDAVAAGELGAQLARAAGRGSGAGRAARDVRDRVDDVGCGGYSGQVVRERSSASTRASALRRRSSACSRSRALTSSSGMPSNCR